MVVEKRVTQQSIPFQVLTVSNPRLSQLGMFLLESAEPPRMEFALSL